MSWKDKNNIKRIFNTFKRVKTKIFQEDLDALKELNETIDLSAKKTSIDNILYSKVLCVLIRLNLEYYGDIKLAIKKANDELKQPIDFHLQFLEKSLNNIDLINYFKSIGIDFESYKDQPDILANNQKEIIEKLKFSWSKENVEKAFYNTAESFLKDIENYK